MKYWNVKKWRITAVISSHVNVVATVIKKKLVIPQNNVQPV